MSIIFFLISAGLGIYFMLEGDKQDKEDQEAELEKKK